MRKGQPLQSPKSPGAHGAQGHSATPSAEPPGFESGSCWKPVSNFDGYGRRVFSVWRRRQTHPAEARPEAPRRTFSPHIHWRASRRLAPHRDQQDDDNGSEQDGRSNPHAGHLTPPSVLDPSPCSDILGRGGRRQSPPEPDPQIAGLPPAPECRCAGMPRLSASQTIAPMCAGSPPEEGPIELSRLRGGQSWLRERVDNLIGQVPLPGGKGRRVSIVPAQPRTDVGVEPHFLPRDLVGEPMQVSHLLEQGLELRIVDRHLVPRLAPRAKASAASAAGRGRNPALDRATRRAVPASHNCRTTNDAARPGLPLRTVRTRFRAFDTGSQHMGEGRRWRLARRVCPSPASVRRAARVLGAADRGRSCWPGRHHVPPRHSRGWVITFGGRPGTPPAVVAPTPSRSRSKGPAYRALQSGR